MAVLRTLLLAPVPGKGGTVSLLLPPVPPVSALPRGFYRGYRGQIRGPEWPRLRSPTTPRGFFVLFLDPPLGVDGRKAAITYHSRGLPIACVAHLLGREHPGHVRYGALFEDDHAAVGSALVSRLLSSLLNGH